MGKEHWLSCIEDPDGIDPENGNFLPLNSVRFGIEAVEVGDLAAAVLILIVRGIF